MGKRFQVKERQMHFNLTKYKKFTDAVLDLALQQIIKKLPVDKFWHDIKEEYLQLPEKTIKILLLLPTTYLCEAGFSSYISTKTALMKYIECRGYENPAVFH